VWVRAPLGDLSHQLFQEAVSMAEDASQQGLLGHRHHLVARPRTPRAIERT